MSANQKSVDFPVLIAHLKASGLTNKSIAKKAGMHETTISSLSNESINFNDSAIRLLQLFWLETDVNIPFVGDHHEILDEESA